MSDNNQPLVREQVRPTLIIGLGGSGKKTLLKIRRRFYDRYGSLGNFPSIAYLYLDTDTNDVVSPMEAGGHRLVAQAIELNNDERLNITVSETKPYVDKPGENPHVAEWFYPNLRSKGDLTQGAGAIRPYGRLAFFHNYEGIRTAIEKAKAQITDLRSLEKTQNSGMRVVSDGSIDVFIIGSVAGGTGSGTLLDTTFLVKQLIPTAKRYGFVVLPKVFGPRSSGESRYANSYAALKEINHFTHRADANRVVEHVDELESLHDFRVQWSKTEPVRAISGPPFHYLYLADGNNERGIASDAEGIYELTADAIFYEFAMNAFGSQKRSLRDNTDQFLCQVAVVKDEDGSSVNRPQPKHYSGFGLARVTYPADEVAGACGAIMGQKLVAYWEKANGEQVTPQLIDEFLQRDLLKAVGLFDTRQKGRKGTRDVDSQIVAALARGTTSGRTIFDELHTWVDNVKSEATRLAGHKLLAPILRERLQEKELKMSGWDTGATSELTRQLDSNLQVKQSQVLAALGEEIDKLLSLRPADGPNQAADGTPIRQAAGGKSLAFVQRAVNRLHELMVEENTGYIGYFKEEKARAEKDRTELRRQFDAALLELDMEGDRMPGFHPWKGMTSRFLANRAVQYMKGYLDAHARAAVFTYAVAFCQWVREQLREENTGGERAKLTVLANTLAGVKQVLQEQELRFKQVRQNAHQLVLFKEQDLEPTYRDLLLGQSEEELVAGRSREVLQQLGVDLFSIGGAVQRMGVAGVADAVLNACKAPFKRQLNADPKYEAMRMFRKLYPDDQAQTDRLRHLFDAARSWVNLRDDKGREEMRAEQRQFIVGRYQPENAGEEYRNFDKQLDRAVDAGTLINKYPTDVKHEVVIYCEIGGYPLFLLSGLSDMQESYKAVRDREGHLHIDHHEAKFGELVPLVGEGYRQYREIVRVFALAQVLGMMQIKYHPQSHRPIFVFPVDRGFGLPPREEYLGYEDTALERLQQRVQLWKEIREQVNKRLAAVAAKGPEAMAALYALLAHYQEAVYPTQQVHAHGGAFEYENPIFTAVLDAELKKIQSEWEAVPAWGQWATEYTEELRRSRRLAVTRALAPDIEGMADRLALII